MGGEMHEEELKKDAETSEKKAYWNQREEEIERALKAKAEAEDAIVNMKAKLEREERVHAEAQQSKNEARVVELESQNKIKMTQFSEKMQGEMKEVQSQKDEEMQQKITYLKKYEAEAEMLQKEKAASVDALAQRTERLEAADRRHAEELQDKLTNTVVTLENTEKLAMTQLTEKLQ